MSVVPDTSYSLRLSKLRRVALMILMLLGLLIFAAVRDMAGKCVTENPCLADSGGCIGDAGGALGAGKTTQCALTLGDWLRLKLSEQAADILRRFGIPVSYI